MKKTLVLLLILYSSFANAEWTYIGGGETTDVFYDKSKVKVISNHVRVWVLYNMDKPTLWLKSDCSFQSYIVLKEFDCLDEKEKDLTTAFYKGKNGNKESIGSMGEDKSWSYVVPQSVGENIMKRVCLK